MIYHINYYITLYMNYIFYIGQFTFRRSLLSVISFTTVTSHVVKLILICKYNINWSFYYIR